MTASAFSKNRQRHERLEHLQAQSALAADRETRISFGCGEVIALSG